MSLRLICGRAGTGKSEYCFDEISKIMENESTKIYIVTPEQFSFTAEKKLLEKTKSKGVLQAEVITFQRMAYRLLTEVGGATKTFLSEAGKSMLLYNLLLQNRRKLKFLGKSDKNMEVVNRQFTEFKKHGITVEKLKEAKEIIEDETIKWKIQDMLTIYEPFEQCFQNEYRNQEDSLTILKQALKVTELFDNCYFYIDEFVGFKKQEYDIIEILLGKCKRITVTICSDNLDTMTNRDTDIFYTNKQTASKLIYLAKSQEVSLEKTLFLQKTHRFKSADLSYLQENLYENSYKPRENIENIKLFLGANPYSEVEQVAKEIIKLVKIENYRYKDIAIITKNIENYASLCKAIFNKYEIPYFIDEKKNLSQNNFVKYICSILEIFSKNWSYETVFNYVKTKFLPIEDDEIYKLENFCQKWGIKGSKWYKDEWNFEEETEGNKLELQRIKELREIIVAPLQSFKSKFIGAKTVEQMTKEIYNFLIQN